MAAAILAAFYFTFSLVSKNPQCLLLHLKFSNGNKCKSAANRRKNKNSNNNKNKRKKAKQTRVPYDVKEETKLRRLLLGSTNFPLFAGTYRGLTAELVDTAVRTSLAPSADFVRKSCGFSALSAVKSPNVTRTVLSNLQG